MPPMRGSNLIYRMEKVQEKFTKILEVDLVVVPSTTSELASSQPRHLGSACTHSFLNSSYQRVLNDLQRARYYRCCMIWLLAYPLPSGPLSSVSSSGDTRED